jgi:hypothetical protein
MRKTIRALMLVLALSVCAQAGDMGNGVVNQPPPPSASSTTEISTEQVAGDMGNGVTDAATDIVLNLLQALLALF